MHQRRGCDLPTCTFAFEHELWRNLGIGYENLIERGVTVHLLQRDDLNTWLLHIEDEVREALVLRHIHVGSGEQQSVLSFVGTRRPYLLTVDDPLVAFQLSACHRASQIGTPYVPEFDGRVLFLEDVGERPYRVDRMLTTLRQCGALDGVAGVALGAFTGGAPGADGVSVADVLRERFADAPYPVVMGLPAGHIETQFVIPLGLDSTLDADTGELRF